MVRRTPSALCLLLGVVGCEPPASGDAPAARSADPSASTPAAVSAADAMPAAASAPEPIDAKSVRERVGGAAAVRIWEYEPAPSGGAPRMLAVVLREPAEVREVLDAVGGDQKPQPLAKEECAPCQHPRHLVFEDRRGLHLGAVELGCMGDDGARFRLPASDICGEVKIAQASALETAWTRARARPKSDDVPLRNARVPGPTTLP